jgi:outer membrane lipoprotein-sorting protein
VLAVYLGRLIAMKVNRRVVSRIAGAVFIVVGVMAFLSGCSNEESPKLVLRKVAEKYKAMDSCVLEYSIKTEGGGEVSEIGGTVYAKNGALRYEETVTTSADTLKQIRVSDGQTIYQILPEHGVVKGMNLEPGSRESNLRAVEQKGALVSVLPIPDEEWNPRGGVRTQGRGADRRLVVVASPPGAPGGARSTYTFFIEPETYLIREIEADLAQQLAAGVIKTRARNSYWNYRVQAEVLDTMFQVNTGEK